MEAFSIIAGRLRQALSTIKKEIPSRNSHFLLQAFVSQAGKSINPENKKRKTLDRVLTLERKEHYKIPWALPSSPRQGCASDTATVTKAVKINPNESLSRSQPHPSCPQTVPACCCLGCSQAFHSQIWQLLPNTLPHLTTISGCQIHAPLTRLSCPKFTQKDKHM